MLLSLNYLWGAHDDFRLNVAKRAIPYDLKLHYEKLSSVMESSPTYRWSHLKRNYNYNKYRSHKYLYDRYLPFHNNHAHYRGFRSPSTELNKLRPHPPYIRTLEIVVPSCKNHCKEVGNISPFLFDDY